MSVGHGVLGLGILRNPLPGAGRALGQIPVIFVQIVEEPVVPLRRFVGPGAFEAAGYRVLGRAASIAVLPAEALFLDGRSLGLGTDVLRMGRAMSLADSVAANNECSRLLVIHCHATERFSDVPSGDE